MKKLLLSVLAIAAFAFTNAQNTGQTATGKWLIEANTGFGAVHPAQTSIQFAATDDTTVWNVGLEGGYFVIDNLAIKAGLGYGETKYDDGFFEGKSSSFSYKIGAKYYAAGVVPVQLDFSGTSIEDVEDDPSYIGFQAGYAWFLGDNVSIEPGVRYNLATDSDLYQNVLEFNLGFALHF